MTRFRFIRYGVPFALFVLPWPFACAKKEQSAASSSSANPASNASAALGQPGAAGGEGAPMACRVTTEKVWTKAPTTSAGITPTILRDGRIALGLVLDGKPQVIVFDANGDGEATAVELSKDLREAPKDKAKRVYYRITPGLGSGGAVLAFADYKETSEERHRVSCGPTDSSRKMLEFDGKPLIKEKPEEEAAREAKEEKGAPAASAPGSAAAPPASAPARASAEAPPESGPHRPPMLRAPNERETARLKSLREIAAKLRAGVAPSAAAPPPAAAPEKSAAPAKAAPPPAPTAAKTATPKTESAGKEKLKELRECRTFVDAGGEHAWAAGNELVGDELKDGKTKYSVAFFVQRELGRGRIDLHSYDLGTEPEEVYTFEAPSAYETTPGSFVLTARYRGTLLAWSLDADKRPRGAMRSYGGGYPTAVQFASDGGPVMLLAQRAASGRWELRYGRVDASGTLPGELGSIVIPGRTPSLSDPHLVQIGTQRWLSYRAGDSTPNALRLSPVNDRLWPESTPIILAEPTEQVVESELFTLGQNRMLAAYIRTAGGKAELVTKILTCG